MDVPMLSSANDPSPTDSIEDSPNHGDAFFLKCEWEGHGQSERVRDFAICAGLETMSSFLCQRFGVGFGFETLREAQHQ